jgi:hypothetical protein
MNKLHEIPVLDARVRHEIHGWGRIVHHMNYSETAIVEFDGLEIMVACSTLFLDREYQKGTHAVYNYAPRFVKSQQFVWYKGFADRFMSDDPDAMVRMAIVWNRRQMQGKTQYTEWHGSSCNNYPWKSFPMIGPNILTPDMDRVRKIRKSTINLYRAIFHANGINL